MRFVYITHASFHSFNFLFSVDMLAHAIDNAAPSTIVLISGDRDFAYALSILRFRGYRIVLITLSNAHQSLRAQASISFDWVSEVLEPVDPTLSKQPTSSPPRRGKMSSPPAPSHDKFYSDSPVPSCRTYPNGSLQTSLDTLAACNSDLEPNFASRTIQTQTRLLRMLRTLQDSPLEASCRLDAPSENSTLIRDSSPLSHQQGSPSLNNATRHPSLSSVDRMALDDNPPANVSTPSLTPPSPTLSSAEVSAITENPMEPTTLFPVDPEADPARDKLKLLVQCLKSHKRSRGSLSLLRSKLGLDVDENGTTYRISGNSRRRHLSSIIVPDKFKILIRCLKSHRSRGNLYSLRRKISSEISQSGITYLLAGVSTFGEYATMAEKAGIIELGGSGSNAWIALKAPWYNVTNVCLS